MASQLVSLLQEHPVAALAVMGIVGAVCFWIAGKMEEHEHHLDVRRRTRTR